MTYSQLPFLRWAGGKRWIAPSLKPTLKQVLQGRYIEPFLGSAAVFFCLEPRSAVLSDLNADLINVYEQVRKHPKWLESQLESMPVDPEMYYLVRSAQPPRRLDQALRFIYLNRTCFGGLHRTNRAGDFNVPYGGGSRTPEPLYREHLLVNAASVLKRTDIRLMACDFAETIRLARKGDVVFCDPTYQCAERGRFDRYGPLVFSWSDQRRLAILSAKACERGAVVVIMNADTHDIRKVYREATLLASVGRRKTIGNPASDDSRHRELIAVFDPLNRKHLWDGVREQLLPFQVDR